MVNITANVLTLVLLVIVICFPLLMSLTDVTKYKKLFISAAGQAREDVCGQNTVVIIWSCGA